LESTIPENKISNTNTFKKKKSNTSKIPLKEPFTIYLINVNNMDINGLSLVLSEKCKDTYLDNFSQVSKFDEIEKKEGNIIIELHSTKLSSWNACTIHFYILSVGKSPKKVVWESVGESDIVIFHNHQTPNVVDKYYELIKRNIDNIIDNQ
jgi:hypothetical protein